MSATAEWVVAPEQAGARLDHFVAERAGCSHGAARRSIDSGAVRVDGLRAAKGTRLAAGARVTVAGPLPGAQASAPVPEPDAPLEVLAVEPELVVLAKPPGVATHPLRPGERGTLAGALVARFPECAAASPDPREAGLVHRLDAGTSGVVAAARSRAEWIRLRTAFGEGRVEKVYWALVAGTVAAPVESRAAIAHDPRDRRRVVALDDPRDAERLGGRPAATRFRPLASGGGFTLVEARSSSGRMHQVRAHLAHLGHPLAGDPLYGGPPALEGAPGHFLHARSISLPRADRTVLAVQADLPEPRAQALRRLGLGDSGGGDFDLGSLSGP